MNKTILVSLSVIAVVAALAIGGTIAYFNDTETSSGNTFTAGTLDLRFQADKVTTDGKIWEDVNGVALFNGNPTGGTFPLYDLKPGDTGERTVKLWVDGNYACGFIDVVVTSDLDNTCTEPELLDETGCKDTNVGELNDEVSFLVWQDDGAGDGIKCDNKLNGTESILFDNIVADGHYSIGGIPNNAENAICYGIAYCFGDWVNGSCNGTIVNNQSQTDSFSADLIIKAEQYRNQYGTDADFPTHCPQVGPYTPKQPS